jgi:phytoene dehydrogenase-like protein
MSPDGVVVIGGGLAGLAAAVRIAGTGRAVTVLERNPEPGGCATSFRRGRFAFEASLHLLDAVGPAEPNREVLDGLGVSLDLVRPEPLRREIRTDLDLSVDLPQRGTLGLLCRSYPDDADGVRALFALAARVHRVGYARLHRDEPPWDDLRLVAELAREPAAALIARHVRDPRARALVGSQAHYVGVGPEQLGAVPFLVLLHGYVAIGGWAARGGSRALTEALTRSLAARGGRLELGVDVTGIELRGRRVGGVVAADGRRWDTRAVVAAIAPPVVYERLLPADADPVTRSSLAGRPIGPSFARLSVGLTRDLPDVPYEIGVDGCAITVPTVVDPSWAPGGAVATCTIAVPPGPRFDPGPLTEALLARLDRWLVPGVRDLAEVVDLAQPATYARYVGAPDGAVLGYALAPGVRPLTARTGVDGLWLAGGWVAPGPGQTAALISGWLAAREATRGLA